ncbi:MAG: manganese efflux pump [Clostridia bacterium]|nr:manganese efflux pump [Clostridia bacterium]
MDLNTVFFLNSILLGIGLAIDAFSVSIVNTLNEPHMKKRKMICIAGTFSFFQAAMPLTGWILVRTVVGYFKALEKFIPWAALILLGYIGIKMLIEGINGGGEAATGTRLTLPVLLIQGVATSIDALSVGFTIVDYDLVPALICAIIIAAVTFVICMTGLLIGRTLGTKLSGKASILGGIILIGIGIEIFIKSFI